MKTYETCPKTAVRGDVYYNDGSFHTGLASAILQRAKLRVRELVRYSGGSPGPCCSNVELDSATHRITELLSNE